MDILAYHLQPAVISRKSPFMQSYRRGTLAENDSMLLIEPIRTCPIN